MIRSSEGAVGHFAVSFLSGDSEILFHEIGHSFGKLQDEYAMPEDCSRTIPTDSPNVTSNTSLALIPWSIWISPFTPIPTTATSPGVPGLYAGAYYCKTGKYRPTFESKMRLNGKPYEQINTEQLVIRMYGFVPLPLSFSPAETRLTLTQGEEQTFQVTVPVPLTHNAGRKVGCERSAKRHRPIFYPQHSRTRL